MKSLPAILAAAVALCYVEQIGSVAGTVLGFLTGTISSAVQIALR